LTAHLYACAVNNPKAYIHHPFSKNILFRRDDGTFEIYNPEVHGENVWIPPEDDEHVEEEYHEASISMERDLEEYLSKNFGNLLPGLSLVERQSKTDVGFIDILAKEKDGNFVVIELKIGEAKDAAVGQVTRYMGWIMKHRTQGKAIKSFLIASDFSDGTKYSAAIVPGLKIVRFKARFEFESLQE
jgi:endonuclease